MPQSISPSCERIVTSCILVVPICQLQIHNDKLCPSSTQSFVGVPRIVFPCTALHIVPLISISCNRTEQSFWFVCVTLIVFSCTVLRMVPKAPYQHLLQYITKSVLSFLCSSHHVYLYYCAYVTRSMLSASPVIEH